MTRIVDDYRRYGATWALLFGKYAGQFWIESHVRGREEAGVVVKEYDVAAGG